MRVRLARLDLKRGDRREALKHVTEAIAHYEQVVARTNAVANRRELGNALVTFADVRSDSPAESCAAFRRAREIFAATGTQHAEHYAARAIRGAAACQR